MNESKQFKATIGLDWADQKHDLWIRPADGWSTTIIPFLWRQL
jgi:hypothetical protein